VFDRVRRNQKRSADCYLFSIREGDVQRVRYRSYVPAVDRLLNSIDNRATNALLFQSLQCECNVLRSCRSPSIVFNSAHRVSCYLNQKVFSFSAVREFNSACSLLYFNCASIYFVAQARIKEFN